MGKFLLAVVAAVASFMLVDSLTCNQCSFGLLGFCLNKGTQNCSSSSSVCYTGKATFPSVSSFSGFSSQGCLDNSLACNVTTNSTLLGVSYQVQFSCCSTDNCNPFTISSSAPSSKITFSAAIATAFLASVWGSML